MYVDMRAPFAQILLVCTRRARVRAGAGIVLFDLCMCVRVCVNFATSLVICVLL